MFRLKYLALFIIVLLMTACSSSVRPIKYYWGDYSHTYYRVLLNANAESKKSHLEEIEGILKRIKEEPDYKIPPGLYAEYAFMQLDTNNKSEYDKYIALELRLYPESQKFLDTVSKLMSIKEDKK